MHILSLTPQNQAILQQAAQLLTDAFREHWSEAWPTLEDSVKEIQEMLDEERICRIAIDDEVNLLGIIGGIPQYDGHVWELHPAILLLEYAPVYGALLYEYRRHHSRA